MRRLFAHTRLHILLLPLAFLDEFVILLVIELQCMFGTQSQLDQGLLLLTSFFVGKVYLHMCKLLKRARYHNTQTIGNIYLGICKLFEVATYHKEAHKQAFTSIAEPEFHFSYTA